jgi:hypothetical protein
MAIQLSARDINPNYTLIGSLYQHLINISANRKQAYEKIEEFEQLLLSVGKQNASSSTHDLSFPIEEFCSEDIDSICSASYNYGISLIDLDMSEMAEKFICKSLSLLNFASQSMSSWKHNMQDAYSAILRAKCEARKLTSKRDSNIMLEVVSDLEQLPRSFLDNATNSVEKDTALSVNMFM